MPRSRPPRRRRKAIESRFVLWFNGNGIPERYWIPAEDGPDYDITPCLAPLAPFRDDVHVLSGLDNAPRPPGPGNGHHQLDERPDDRHAASPGAAPADLPSTR